MIVSFNRYSRVERLANKTLQPPSRARGKFQIRDDGSRGLRLNVKPLGRSREDERGSEG